MEALENVCKFHYYGHCKFVTTCKKQHIVNTCTSFPCKNKQCLMRHPRLCKYFSQFARCKFGDQCSYLHRSESNQDSLESEIENLKLSMAILKRKYEDLEMKIALLNTSDDQPESQPEHNTLDNTSPCDSCDFTCEGQDFLEHHKQSVHEVKQTTSQTLAFKCDFCNYTSTSQKGVNIHKGSKHKNKKGSSSSTSTNFPSASSDISSLNTPLQCRRREDGCQNLVVDYIDKFAPICSECITFFKNLQKPSPFPPDLCPACHEPSVNHNYGFCSPCTDWINEDGFRESDWGSWILNRSSGEIICIQLDF